MGEAPTDKRPSLPRFFRGFAHAFRGVALFLRREQNAWFHLAATIAVVTFGLAVGLDSIEWQVLILVMGLVWTAEAFNTAIEFALDRLHPEHHPAIGAAKDVASGAVLLASFAAIAVGVLLLGPKLLALLGGPGRP